MKQGWKLCKLEDVCDFQNGFAFKSTSFTKEGEPIIRISDIQNGEIDDSNVVYFNPTSYKEDLSRFLVFPNDILIAMSGGTTGKIGVNTTNKTFYLNQRVGVFREKAALNHNYLYYYLITKSEESLRIAAGAAQPNLSTAQIRSFVIPVPPLSEQQRIVDILDAEFAKIDALKENAEKNLQNAKDLFQAVLRKELEPKDGWDEKTLKQIGVTQTGTTPKTSEKNNYGDYIPFIKPADINVDGLGGLNYENEGLSRLGAQKGRIFTANSVLMVCIGATIGKVGFSTKEVSSNQQINILSPYKDNCKYIYYCMASPKFQQEVIKEGESAKATLPIINKSKWENLKIHIPPLSVQNQIVDILDTLSAKCKSLQGNYDKTATLCSVLKQALLRKAFNGEL